jgi:hypothetical protein
MTRWVSDDAMSNAVTRWICFGAKLFAETHRAFGDAM